MLSDIHLKAQLGNVFQQVRQQAAKANNSRVCLPHGAWNAFSPPRLQYVSATMLVLVAEATKVIDAKAAFERNQA